MISATVQLISSIIFAVASALIAAASLFIAYRNNFGWKPIVLVTNYSISGSSKTPGVESLEVEFEFWNRRKYPIVIREMKVFFDGIDFVLDEDKHTKDWSIIQKNVVQFRQMTRLESNSPQSFKFVGAIRPTKIGAITHSVRVHANYFDPRINKNLVETGLRNFWDI